MTSAKDIKSHATSAKRTATSIKRIVDAQGHLLPGADLLGEHDKKQLKSAVDILNRFGTRAAEAARRAAEQEKAKSTAIEAARRLAVGIMARWPAATTVLDKVVLIMGNHGEYGLRKNLEEDDKDYAWSLNYYFELALREIPFSAAYRAVEDGKSVADLMAGAADKLAEIKARSKTKELANQWEEKIARQARAAPASHLKHG